MAKVTETIKLEREKRKTALQDRLLGFLDTPNTKRLLSLVTIVAITGILVETPNKGVIGTALQEALPAIGIPLIAADAGITSWEALAAIGLLSAAIPFIPTIEHLASGNTQKELGQKTLGMAGWLTGQGYLPAP
jgi:hypothetical protein